MLSYGRIHLRRCGRERRVRCFFGFRRGFVSLEARFARRDEGAAFRDFHPGGHAFSLHERYGVGVEVSKAAVPGGEVGRGGGCVCCHRYGRGIFAFGLEVVDDGDLCVFVSDRRHVHNVEIPAEVSNASGLLVLVKKFVAFTFEPHLRTTAREVRN